MSAATDPVVVAARQALLERLIPAVAHDANNGLGTLLSNLRFLEAAGRGTLEPSMLNELDDALHDSRSAVNHISLLVQGLRLLSRGDAGRTPAAGPLLETAGALCRYLLRPHADVRVDLADGPPPDGHQGALLHAVVEALLGWGPSRPATSVLVLRADSDPSYVAMDVPGPEPLAPNPIVERLLGGPDALQITSTADAHHVRLRVPSA